MVLVLLFYHEEYHDFLFAALTHVDASANVNKRYQNNHVDKNPDSRLLKTEDMEACHGEPGALE